MPVFAEDPTRLSKSRLKSDLIAHNVALPPAKSKKQVYVDLHQEHISHKNAADFSSDEEDQDRVVAGEEEIQDDGEVLDPASLADDDLRAELLKHGVRVGPIVASTRALYERKLRTLLQTADGLNGAEGAALYSDSEEEVENAEESEESDSEVRREEFARQADANCKVKAQFYRGDHTYHRCFALSTRLRAYAHQHSEPRPKRNVRNVSESSKRGNASRPQIPAAVRASPAVEHSGLRTAAPSGSAPTDINIFNSSSSSKTFSITQMMESRRSLTPSREDKVLNRSNVQEHWSCSDGLDTLCIDKSGVKNQTLYYTPEAYVCRSGLKAHATFAPQDSVTETSEEKCPDAEPSPVTILVTPRRPIKGAAGRPVQYKYPDTNYPECPVSPTTLERREVERRVVPVHVQIVVFFTLACLLYLIYIYVDNNSCSPFVALLDILNQALSNYDPLLLEDEAKDPAALSKQE